MSLSSPRKNLLWATLGESLERGRSARPALLAGSRTLSYGELTATVIEGANDVTSIFPADARLLVAARDQLVVGLSFLAALQAGRTPVLADPTSVERLRELSRVWGFAGLLGDAAIGEALGVETIGGERIGAWMRAGNAANAIEPPTVEPQTPAFWTFTSGTTGEPTAVVHGHGGPRAAYDAFARGVLGLGAADVTIATGGLPFVYVLGNNFLFPLMAGAAAVLPEDLLLPTVLAELVRHRATVLVGGPWSLAALVRLARHEEWRAALRALRLVLSAGEPLPIALFDDWKRELGHEVLDNLGCTEMFNSFLSNRPGAVRPGSLGEVVPGFEVEVGDRVPESGARGMLRVRGDSRAVALGCDGRIAPPLGAWCDTGDEVAVDEDGSFIFLGRTDDRFKVKGRFLRPVEVERCFLEVEGVREALVTREVDAGGLALVAAAVVPVEGVDRAELVRRCTRHARARLERFMVPARIRVVEALPRSARGKLVRPRERAIDHGKCPW